MSATVQARVRSACTARRARPMRGSSAEDSHWSAQQGCCSTHMRTAVTAIVVAIREQIAVSPLRTAPPTVLHPHAMPRTRTAMPGSAAPNDRATTASGSGPSSGRAAGAASARRRWPRRRRRRGRSGRRAAGPGRGRPPRPRSSPARPPPGPRRGRRAGTRTRRCRGAPWTRRRRSPGIGGTGAAPTPCRRASGRDGSRSHRVEVRSHRDQPRCPTGYSGRCAAARHGRGAGPPR